MSNPFQEGDRVYVSVSEFKHPVIGVQGDDVFFIDDGGETVGVHYRGCSFEPWPKPVHIRPVEHGFWLVSFKYYRRTYLAHYDKGRKDGGPWILIGPDGRPITDHTYSDANNGHIKPITYLGTVLRNFSAT